MHFSQEKEYMYSNSDLCKLGKPEGGSDRRSVCIKLLSLFQAGKRGGRKMKRTRKASALHLTPLSTQFA